MIALVLDTVLIIMKQRIILDKLFINVVIIVIITLCFIGFYPIEGYCSAFQKTKSKSKQRILKLKQNQMSNYPLKIALIDSGIRSKESITVCKDGYIDFTNTNLDDTQLHGTNIALIATYGIPKDKYCAYVLKVFDKGVPEIFNIPNINKALKWVSEHKDIKVVNLSYSGMGYSVDEKTYILQILENGAIINVAAGNNGMELDKLDEKFKNEKKEFKCNVYPACYDKRLNVVGNIFNKTSNTGSRITHWENGNDVEMDGIKMSGTSQATAILTNKTIRELLK